MLAPESRVMASLAMDDDVVKLSTGKWKYMQF